MASKRITQVCCQCGRLFQDPSSHQRRYCSNACRFIGSRRPAEQYFWERVKKTDSCWLWTGRTHEQNGYGHITDNDGRHLNAHRFSWILAHGPIPAGLVVCHNCPGGDNPRCVNPAHLWLGTQADNIADQVAKGRAAKGEGHGMSKLTSDQVRAIRARYAEGGVTYDNLARTYGVDPTTIGMVIRRRVWKHV